MKHEVELLAHQWDTLQQPYKFTLLLGGIGSGKSWCGAHWCLKKVNDSPRSLGFIGANSYSQLHQSTLATVFTELTHLGVSFSYNQNKNILTIQNKRFLCKSLDNYDMLRGIEIGEFWLDEARDAKEEAWQVILGRLRDKKGKLDGLVTTTPKGFNWLHEYFNDNGEKHTDKFGIVRAKSLDNTFLPEGYLDTLYEQYDSELVKQELEGEFVNIAAGRVYYSFTRENNIYEFEKKDSPIYIGMDFNINPMCAVCCQLTENSIYVFDEIYQKNSNTYNVAETIKDRYGTDNIKIVPDSTGKALKTSSKKSDHQILRDIIGNDVVVYNVNPFREDRFNCVNGLLDKKRIIIHPKCKMLIKDLEQYNYEDDNPMLSHISDALGYLAWKYFPLKRPRRKSRIIQL